MRLISTLSFEAGTSSSAWPAPMALRTRVRESGTGAVSIGSVLPARLDHSGDVALVCRLAQAESAEAELAVVGTRATAATAAVVAAGLVLRLPRLLDDVRSLGHGLGGYSSLDCCSAAGSEA